MLNRMKNQRFGVEVEFTGITREQAAELLAKHFGTVAKQVSGSPYYKRIIKDDLDRKWQIVRDSSILAKQTIPAPINLDEYRCEMVTPILHYSDIEDLQQILRVLKAGGAVVNKSCGIHIHVDGCNHDAGSLKRLVKFFVARQDLIFKALDVDDERINNYCQPTTDTLLKALNKKKGLDNDSFEAIWYSKANDGYSGGINYRHYNCTRYHALNLHSFFTKGTVEFRLFNSTLHAGKVKAYVQFVLALSAWAIESPDKIAFRSIVNYTPQQNVTIMSNLLKNRLELSGDEFKTCRLHMLASLKKRADVQQAA